MDEEFGAVVDIFALKEGEYGAYAAGWLESPDGLLSIVAAQCTNTGSVEAAVTTARMFEDWQPSTVFLVGRCGGWREQNDDETEPDEDYLWEGDVIVASDIIAYEYQKLDPKEDGTYDIKYEARPVTVSGLLKSSAARLLGKKWKYKGKLPDYWEDERRPKAVSGAYACGCKLIKVGADWFEDLRKSVGKQKIIGIEMEAEGVRAAVSLQRPRPEFLMIKAVSDFADPNKTDKYKVIASRTSARFLFDLLSQRGLGDRILGNRGR